MSKPLPYRNFRWASSDRTKQDWINYINTKKDSTGHIYELDLEYPSELHHLHNDYPCAAEKLCVSNEMFSDYCQSIKDKFKISNGKVRKLIPTLYDKKSMFFIKKI